MQTKGQKAKARRIRDLLSTIDYKICKVRDAVEHSTGNDAENLRLCLEEALRKINDASNYCDYL